MNLRILVETMRTLDGVVGTILSSRLRKKFWVTILGSLMAVNCSRRYGVTILGQLMTVDNI